MLTLELPWTRQPQELVPAVSNFYGATLKEFFTPVLPGRVISNLVRDRKGAPYGVGSGSLTTGCYREFSLDEAHIRFNAGGTGNENSVSCTLGSDDLHPSLFTTNFSLLLRVKIPASTYSGVLIGGSVSGTFYAVVGADGAVSLISAGIAVRYSSAAGAVPTDGRWFDLGIVVTAAKTSIIVDGVETSSGSGYTYTRSAGAAYYLARGGVGPTQYIVGDGRIAAAALFVGALPAEAFKLLKGNGLWKHLLGSQQIIIPTPAAAGYTHPTLSLATAIDVTATSFKPRVTYTFPS